MKRVLSLVLVLGVAALFSSAALAGADCSYHQTQAAVTKSSDTASKDVVIEQAATDSAATDSKVQTAKADQNPVVKRAPATKK